MKQSLLLKLRIRWHCFRKRHNLIKGFRHGQEIIYCKCGYFMPRVNPRGEEIPFDPRKHLTDPEARKLLEMIGGTKPKDLV